MARIAAKPTVARRRRAAPLPPGEGEKPALDHACPATQRSRRARAARKAGIRAHATVPITPALVAELCDADPPYLKHCDRHDKKAIRTAFLAYWRAMWGL